MKVTDTPPSSEPTPDEEPATALESTEPSEPFAQPETTEPQSSNPLDWTVVTLVALLFLSILLVPLHVYKFADLPAHVLVNHIPIVLIPVLAVMSVVAIWKDAWRTRYALALAIAGLVTTVSTTVSAATGSALADHLVPAGRFFTDQQQLIHEHSEAGETLRMIVFIFATILIAHFVIVRLIKAETPYVTIALKIATTVFAVLALGSVIYTAHLGVEATWKDRVNTPGLNQRGSINQPYPYGSQNQQQMPYQQRRFNQSLPQNTTTTTTISKSNL